MTNVNISLATIKAIGDFSNKSLTGDKAKTKAADSLIADGVTSEQLKAPKKDQDRSLYDAIGRAVVTGFSVAAQAMLAADIKSLAGIGDDAALNRDRKCKENRRYWQQQIGSKIGDLRAALARREVDESESEGKSSTLESRIKRDLAKYVAQLEKVESFKGDVVSLLKTLRSASAYIKD